MQCAYVEAANRMGETPLHLACKCTRLEAHKKWSVLDQVKYLVEKAGADIHAMDNNGQTPLHVACMCGHTRTVVYLVGWIMY
jgi:ankyrin repeat protein